MNITLWILQGLLAAHTLMGAVWKFTNGTEAVPTLSALPNVVWRGLGIVDILLAIGLVLPGLMPTLAVLAPVAALGVVAEMVLFSVVHLNAQGGERGQLVYWLVVAALCTFVAFGRLSLAPLPAA